MSQEQVLARRFDAVIHATPIGMWPNVNECYFNGVIPGEIVSTWSITRSKPPLTRHAREQGKQVISGIRMFIEQAVRQFEIWTGESAASDNGSGGHGRARNQVLGTKGFMKVNRRELGALAFARRGRGFR